MPPTNAMTSPKSYWTACLLLLLCVPCFVSPFQVKSLPVPSQLNKFQLSPLRQSLVPEDSDILPTAGDGDDDEPFAVDDFSPDEDFQRRSNQWILIVDDEESIRKAVGQLLFDRGFQVTACADGRTALQTAKGRHRDDAGNVRTPDVIVSDVRMPEMDGLELLQIIRQDETLQGIPVVLLTAKGMTQDRIAGYNLGADNYLTKPFDPEELVSICDNVIRQYENLNGHDIGMEDLKKDLDDIKFLLNQGGGGIGNGFVDVGTNVFLAPDEREVLELLCKGLMNKEIAAKTFLSTRRVEQLLTSMYRKVDVKNRTELVRWAISSGNVDLAS